MLDVRIAEIIVFCWSQKNKQANYGLTSKPILHKKLQIYLLSLIIISNISIMIKFKVFC